MSDPLEPKTQTESSPQNETGCDRRPVRWRGEPAPFPENTRRMWLLGGLALLFVSVVGTTLGLISFVDPPPQPYFVGIWTTTLPSLETGTHGPLENDRQAFLNQKLFDPTNQSLLENPQRQGIIDALAGLEELREPIVVYVSAFATLDQAGEAFLLPHGANPEVVDDRIYLRNLLELVGDAKSKQKLLVLDVTWPFAIPELGMYSDDVVNKIDETLQEIADPNLLCLSSCSPGQVAWTMHAPRRSTFGYFFERGIQGEADGFGNRRPKKRDGRITVNELAAYLTSHVDEYSAYASPARQTPLLLGAGADFEIASCAANGQVAASDADPFSPPPFPHWLKLAWTARDQAIAAEAWKTDPQFLRQMESEILRAEMNWHRGGDDGSLALKLESGLKQLAIRFNRQVDSLTSHSSADAARHFVTIPHLAVTAAKVDLPEPISAKPKTEDLVEGNGDEEETPIVSADVSPEAEPSVVPTASTLCPMQLAALFADLEAKQKITPAANWPAIKSQLLDSYKQQTASVPDLALADGLFLFATQAANMSHQHFLTLADIWTRRSKDPVDLQSALLLQIALTLDADGLEHRSLGPAHSIQRTLRLIAESEQPFHRLRTWDWLGHLKASSDDHRYFVESLFWHPSYVDSRVVDERTAAAMAGFDKLAGLAHRIESTLDTLDKAVWRLPAHAKLAHSSCDEASPWRLAANQAASLSKVINGRENRDKMVATQIELSKQIESTATDAAGLQTLLNQLMRPFEAGQLEALLRQLNGPTVSSVRLARVERILASPMIDVNTRVELYKLLGHRAGLLHQQALAKYSPGRLDPRGGLSRQERARAAHDAESRACYRETSYLQVKRVTELGVDSSDNAMAAKRKCAEKTWAHRAKLYGKLSQQTPLAAFYQGLAQQYRSASQVSARPTLHLSNRSVDSDLSSTHPHSQHWIVVNDARALKSSRESPFRNVSNRTSRAASRLNDRVEVNVLQASNHWLTASAFWQPATSKLGLDIALEPGADPNEVSQLDGFFVELKSGSEIFLHRVELPGLARGKVVGVFLADTPDANNAEASEIRLRPSRELQKRFLFVKNLTSAGQEVNVEVQGHKVLCRLQPKETKRIKLPGKPPKPGKPLPQIQNGVHVDVTDAKTNQSLLAKDFHVIVSSPREYVELVRAEFVPFEGGRNRLEVTLRASQEIVGPDCIAELVLNAELVPGLKRIEGGRLRAAIPRTGQPVTLYVENLQLDEVVNEEGQFEISIDGAPRTFVLNNVFARQGNTVTPELTAEPRIRIQAPSRGLAGPDYAVVLQPINVPVESSLSLSLGRADTGAQPDREFKFLTPFETRVGFTANDKGELLFEASIKDWRVNIDTTGLVGSRELTCESILGSMVNVREEKEIVLDNRAPRSVRFHELPERLPAGLQWVFRAMGYSDLTGIETMQLFVGEPEENAIPKAAKAVVCRPVEKSEGLWETQMKVPAKLGEVQLTVAATNGAGLTTFETRTVTVVPPGDLNKGAIAGQVFESVRLQPGLEVILKDPFGKPIAKTKTRFDGRFGFPNVPAGRYTLESVKPASGRRGTTSVRVNAGQTTGVEVLLGL